MYAYPCRLEAEPEGGFTATFRELPEAITYGETLDKALEEAQDVLHCALSSRVERREEIPPPSTLEPEERTISLPLVTQAKVLLYETMRAQKVTKVALAERLGVSEKMVRKLCDLEHRSHMVGVEAALAALGVQLDVTTRERAA